MSSILKHLLTVRQSLTSFGEIGFDENASFLRFVCQMRDDVGQKQRLTLEVGGTDGCRRVGSVWTNSEHGLRLCNKSGAAPVACKHRSSFRNTEDLKWHGQRVDRSNAQHLWRPGKSRALMFPFQLDWIYTCLPQNTPETYKVKIWQACRMITRNNGAVFTRQRSFNFFCYGTELTTILPKKSFNA